MPGAKFPGMCLGAILIMFASNSLALDAYIRSNDRGEWSLVLDSDDQPFLVGGHPSISIPRVNVTLHVIGSRAESGSDKIGSFASTIYSYGAVAAALLDSCSQVGTAQCDEDSHASWKAFVGKIGDNGTILETHFRQYEDGHHFVMAQVFPSGLPAATAADPASVRNRLPADAHAADAPAQQQELISGSAPAQCPGLIYLQDTDQAGGTTIGQKDGTSSDGECCLAAQAIGASTWVRDPTTGNCYFVDGAKTFYPRVGRTVGVLRPMNASFNDVQGEPIAGFPLLNNAESPSLGPASPAGAVQFAGCQTSESTHVSWAGSTDVKGGATDGMPTAVHDLTGRTVVFGPTGNFLVALHQRSDYKLSESGALGSYIAAGIRQSMDKALPPGFEHGTLFVAGQGVMRTMEMFGSALLRISGKSPILAAEDPMLSRLTFWQDHGAWGYHNPSNWSSMQAQDLDQKKGWLAAGVPFRAIQWDDWWMYLPNGDYKGSTYWWPRPDVFPSGLTDWMGVPLSLYNPGYSSDNVYDNTSEARARYGYDWRSDAAGQAIPVGKGEYYRDIFANGTKARGIMFEQDFLCSINVQSNLTNSDLTSGADWLGGMDIEAGNVNWTLQLCMSNPAHALHSTVMSRATNMRATRDNTHSYAGNGLVLGYSAMLIRAMGLYASRDNVWTSYSQPNCSEGSCFQPDVALQNTYALLAGGPYGPSDAPYHTNASLVMRTCRRDGVLLRGDRPIVATDSALLDETARAVESGNKIEPIMVWSTFSDIPMVAGTEAATSGRGTGRAGAGGGGGGAAYVHQSEHGTSLNHGSIARYTYILGTNLENDTELGIDELQPQGSTIIRDSAGSTSGSGSNSGSGSGQFLAWDAWAAMDVDPTSAAPAPLEIHVVTADNNLVLPACPPPSDPGQLNFRYFTTAPVLDGGWVYLGETGKIASASSARVASISSDTGFFNATVKLAPLESMQARVVVPQATKLLMRGASTSRGRGFHGDGSSGFASSVPVECVASCSPAEGTLEALWARDPFLPDINCMMRISCTSSGSGGAVSCACGAI